MLSSRATRPKAVAPRSASIWSLPETPFILHLFAALAEKERAMIATRARDALARAKARGVKLGGPKLAQARKAAVAAIEANADRHAGNVLPIIREIQRAGAKSLRAIADA